jgi:hypothetical protein
MNCRESRFQLALFVGGDLDESSSVEVQRHLATCPECRTHHDGLNTVMDQVERSEAASTAVVHSESVWPQLASVIRVRERNRTRRFNGWVAGSAVAACVLATVTIAQNLPSAQPLTNFRSQFSNVGPMDDFANTDSFQPNSAVSGPPVREIDQADQEALIQKMLIVPARLGRRPNEFDRRYALPNSELR